MTHSMYFWSHIVMKGSKKNVDSITKTYHSQFYLRSICFCLVFTDTCYVLSFAVIMLNTSLHNPNVKDKPTVQRFTAMNRGINDGGDLPEDLLRVGGVYFP